MGATGETESLPRAIEGGEAVEGEPLRARMVLHRHAPDSTSELSQLHGFYHIYCKQLSFSRPMNARCTG